MIRASALAQAPASVGNVAVGFDVLGHALPVLWDRVRATRADAPGVRIVEVTGVAGELPRDAQENTAGRAARSLLDTAGARFGVELSIEKGIPLGAGLGGSAASAVAAAVAVNELLDLPLPRTDLLAHAIEGEAVASGSPHADNVAPSLVGGLVATFGRDPIRIQRIPVPASIRCVVVHPRMFLATRDARAVLNSTVPLASAIRQLGNIAGFIAGCHAGDLGMIRAAFEDVLVEPQRARLIPGFADVKAAALACGALGCSMSGAGPSVFAWCEEAGAPAAAAAMVEAFRRHGLDAHPFLAPIGDEGARILARA